MSKLSDFYAHRRELLKDKGQIEIEEKLVALEEKLLREELMPAVGRALLPLLCDIKTPLSINVNYMPDSGLAMSFTRNSLVMSMTDDVVTERTADVIDSFSSDTSGIEELMPSVAGSKQNHVEEGKTTDYVIACFLDGKTAYLPKRTLKSFRVKFPDGTVFDEGEGRGTLIRTLRKIGLKRICKEAQEVEHAGYKLVGTIPFRDKDGRLDASKQELIEGYYVFKNTDTPDKILDILYINRKFGLGLEIYSYEGVNLTDVEKINRVSTKRNGSKMEKRNATVKPQ